MDCATDFTIGDLKSDEVSSFYLNFIILKFKDVFLRYIFNSNLIKLYMLIVFCYIFIIYSYDVLKKRCCLNNNKVLMFWFLYL